LCTPIAKTRDSRFEPDGERLGACAFGSGSMPHVEVLADGSRRMIPVRPQDPSAT
jgi:hypothetical protein